MTEEQIYISEKVKNSTGIAINPATSESQTEANEILDRMLFVLEAKLKSLWVVTQWTNRLSVDLNSWNIGTVTTLTTCWTVNNVATIWWIAWWAFIKTQSWANWNSYINNL